MVGKLSNNQVGLTVGIFAVLAHLLWTVAVAMNIQKLVDWILLLHSIKLDLVLTQVVILNAIILVILAFAGGYIFGWVFAWLYNLVGKKVK